MNKIEIHILEISDIDAFLFFEPTIVAKTNVMLLESLLPLRSFNLDM